MRNRLERLYILVTKDMGIGRFLKFCLVGLSGAGVQFLVFLLVTRVLLLSDLVALILSTEASILSNFIWNDIWTFRDKKTGSILTRLGKFHMVSLGVVLIYYAIYTPLTRILGFYDLLALAIAIGVGVIWNFTLSVFWTWRKREVQKGAFSVNDG